jgi:hypothetical protein
MTIQDARDDNHALAIPGKEDPLQHAPKPEHKRTGRLIRVVCIAAGCLALLVYLGWKTMIAMPGKSYRGALPPADAALNQLASDLRASVDRLASDIGQRNVLRCPQELADAADYIQAELAAVGYQTTRQEYQVGGTICSNVEAEITGNDQPEEIVIIGAHYDSVVGTPGANDNGSGVAGLLSLARRFSKRKVGRTLRFVAFVNEEPPYFQTDQMGSRVYARRCRERNEQIVAMLSLETIGYYSDDAGSQHYPAPFGLLYPSMGNFIGIVGNLKSRSLVRRVVGTFRKNEPFPCEGGALPALVPGVGFSDQWSFWQEGYHAAMVTDTAMFRYPYYHDPRDTVDKVHFDRVARVVRGLDAVIADLVRSEKGAQQKDNR